jgi:hypothetical protein
MQPMEVFSVLPERSRGRRKLEGRGANALTRIEPQPVSGASQKVF